MVLIESEYFELTKLGAARKADILTLVPLPKSRGNGGKRHGGHSEDTCKDLRSNTHIANQAGALEVGDETASSN
eukprot:CAMPEP_0201668940 /NCGR_PEP_ID=MMETSP0494-20130426/21727_1 /ASSEMBLY_ACC=CAM_ASM_000839 /TAXON_ID=420259 /ORGANISM="Thalassiosira gravida, Strain GMp14c1" /LENGTH=73 /DNA_ID=CAMNT_0048149529 /DNA_START=16 /DNA_END=235 /DNA_ORIENTATION=-